MFLVASALAVVIQSQALFGMAAADGLLHEFLAAQGETPPVRQCAFAWEQRVESGSCTVVVPDECYGFFESNGAGFTMSLSESSFGAERSRLRFLYDGSTLYQYRDGDPEAYVSADREHVLRAQSAASPFMLRAGSILGEVGCVWDTLRENLETATVQRTSSGVIATLIVPGGGKYTLDLVANDDGVDLRALTIRHAVTDAAFDASIFTDECRSLQTTATIHVVLQDYRSCGGSRIPTSVTTTVTLDRDSETAWIRSTTSARQYQLATPWTASIDIPNGTVVLKFGEQSGLQYEWLDGAVVVGFDPRVVRAVDAYVGVGPEGHSFPSASVAAPYCGVNSLYMLLRHIGVDCTYTDLLNVDTIASKKGSSLLELQRAAEAHVADTVLFESMTVSDLFAVARPAILHCKSGTDSADFDHFAAVLDYDLRNRTLLLFDAWNRPEWVPAIDLYRVWGGRALFVGSGADRRTIAARTNVSRLRLTAVTLIVVVVSVSSVALVNTRYRRGYRSLICFATITVGTAVGILGWSATRYAVPASHKDAVDWLTRNAAAAAVTAIDFATLKDEIAQGSVLVDARARSAYSREHIPGALSLPWEATDAEIRSLLTDLRVRYVVYCEGEDCSVGHRLSERLARMGYDVVEYPPGMREWRTYESNEHH